MLLDCWQLKINLPAQRKCCKFVFAFCRLQMAATMFEPLSVTMELTLESIDHSVKMIANALLRVLA